MENIVVVSVVGVFHTRPNQLGSSTTVHNKIDLTRLERLPPLDLSTTRSSSTDRRLVLVHQIRLLRIGRTRSEPSAPPGRQSRHPLVLQFLLSVPHSLSWRHDTASCPHGYGVSSLRCSGRAAWWRERGRGRGVLCCRGTGGGAV